MTKRWVAAAILLACVLGAARASASATAEFEAPYAITVLKGGSIIAVSGIFSWAVPQTLVAVLAGAPAARTVLLDSPGGHIQPAMQVAAIIRGRGLDTYVPRLCASACTVAFLGGAGRFLAPGGRLGFHQAHAPGVAPAQLDPMLRSTYQTAGVPSGFIDHVLRTPPDAVWFPSVTELRSAGLTTGPAPAALTDADDALARAWWQAMRLLPGAGEPSVVAFAEIFSAMLRQLEAAGPDVCWAFLHNMPTDLASVLKDPMPAAMAAVETRIRDEVPAAQAAPIDPLATRRAVEALVRSMRADGKGAALDGLRAESDHAAFCPAMRALVAAALARAADDQGSALRAVLSGY